MDTCAPWNSSWNRIGSTDGAVIRDKQSASMFSYTQMPVKFEHPKQCRNALGLVGGSEVSNITGNIVDLESDLLGITRTQSKCIGQQYTPVCALGGPDCPDTPPSFSIRDRATGQQRVVNTSPRHLPTCQLTTLPGVGLPNPLIAKTCNPMRF